MKKAILHDKNGSTVCARPLEGKLTDEAPFIVESENKYYKLYHVESHGENVLYNEIDVYHFNNTVDLFNTSNIQDPNIFGELLREAIFTKKKDKQGYKQYGCYDNFEVEKDFIAPDAKSRNDLLKQFESELGEDGVQCAYLYVHKDNPAIFVIWYWDGDGMLIVSDGEREACNDDCKKSHNWEFLS
jgi:hypothetical protein